MSSKLTKTGLAQKVIKENFPILHNSFSGVQKKKDSVQAVLIQLYPLEQVINHPDYNQTQTKLTPSQSAKNFADDKPVKNRLPLLVDFRN